MSKVIEFFKNNYYLLTSVLMFFSFPSYDFVLLKGFPFFAWISLVPLFLYVRGKSLKDVFFYTFIASWFGHLFTYQWIGNFAGEYLSGYFLIVFLLVSLLSVFVTLKIFLAEILSRKYEALRFLIYPSVWLSIDFIQTIGYLAFPWTNWGYSQYPSISFIQVSAITGIMGVNFILIMFNYVVSDYIHEKADGNFSIKEFLRTPGSGRLLGVSALVVIITIAGSIVLSRNARPVKKDLRISAVQSCISPWENWTRNRYHYLDVLEEHTLESLAENPDFVIWSESATLEYISYAYENNMLNDFQVKLLEFVKSIEKPLLTGEIGITYRSFEKFMMRVPQNNAVMINKNGEVIQAYSKINLVPFGEWFPYRGFPLIGKPVNALLKKYGASDFVPGKKPVLFEIKGKKFGSLICYEGIFNRLCREYKLLGADCLVNITNDGWTDTFNGHMQHFSASVFRAVENGLWLVRVGNTGYTSFVDPHGRITSSIPILGKGHLVGDIDFSFNYDTFYSRYGDLFFYLTQIFLLVLVMIMAVRFTLLKVSGK